MIHGTLQDNYSAWKWRPENFPIDQDSREKIKFFCGAGILAASIHNTQPWKFRIAGNRVDVFPDISRQLQVADPDGHSLYISIGCCVANIVCAAGHCGYDAGVKIKKSYDRIHYVSLVFEKSSRKIDHGMRYLCPFIPKRTSNKLPYLPKVPNAHDLAQLERIRAGDTKIIILTDPPAISCVAKLKEKAVNRYTFRTGFSRELAKWLRSNHTKEADGMPGFVVGLSTPQSIIGKAVLYYVPQAMTILAKLDRKHIEQSPALGLVLAKKNSVKTWINVGRAYELVNLTAVSIGLGCAPMHAVIEQESTVPEIMRLFHVEKSYQPYMFFRIGYSQKAPAHSPRRSLDSCIM